jgi:hypothetical protein
MDRIRHTHLPTHDEPPVAEEGVLAGKGLPFLLGFHGHLQGWDTVQLVGGDNKLATDNYHHILLHWDQCQEDLLVQLSAETFFHPLKKRQPDLKIVLVIYICVYIKINL